MCTMCIAVLQQADCSLTPSLAPSSESTTSLANTAILPSFQGSNSSEGADAAAGTNTSYEIAVGDRFAGELSSSSDSDWVEIQLEAGESYVFSVWGTNGSADGLTDPAMSLYDENGNELEFNEDVFFSGDNYFSMIEYTASTSGTYYISVDSNYGDSGDYILQATTDVLTVEQVASQLTEYGWGIPTALNHDEQTGDTMTVNLTALTADGEQLALWALEAWSEIMGMTFSTTTSSAADIVFDDNQAGAFAGPSSLNPNTGVINQAIVNVGTQWLVDYGTTYDSYSYLTYLHEIGHALGLTHSGNYNGSATYGVDNYFQNDSHQMTVMSYFSISNAGLGDYAVAVTPMIADVYAIWGLYGEPVTVNAGDTVWGANSNVSGTLGTIMGYLFDGDAVDANIYAGGPIAMTITDTGGYDIIDLSTVSYDQQIDIREGGVSDIGGFDGNVVVSLGTVIEEVIGGHGNDTVFAGDGDGTIFGAAGSDTLSGGDGADEIDGGDGFDFASYATSDAAVQVDLRSSSGDETGGHAEGDDLTSIEGLIGSDYDDNLSGIKKAESYSGGNGEDTINGRGGDDTINGDAGADLLSGGGGKDEINGGTGDDILRGIGGADTLYGGRGADLLEGGALQDVLYGGDDDDTLSGQGSSDSLYGEDGEDILYGGSGSDFLSGGADRDILAGGGGNDSMYGGSGDDDLNGSGGNDTMYGESGDDLLIGFGGLDTYDGGTGSDTLQSASDGSQDTFVFAENYDNDTITNFENDIDAIFLASDIATWAGVSSVAELLNPLNGIMSQIDADTVELNFGAGDVLTIHGTGPLLASDLLDDIIVIA